MCVLLLAMSCGSFSTSSMRLIQLAYGPCESFLSTERYSDYYDLDRLRMFRDDANANLFG